MNSHLFCELGTNGSNNNSATLAMTPLVRFLLTPPPFSQQLFLVISGALAPRMADSPERNGAERLLLGGVARAPHLSCICGRRAVHLHTTQRSPNFAMSSNTQEGQGGGRAWTHYRMTPRRSLRNYIHPKKHSAATMRVDNVVIAGPDTAKLWAAYFGAQSSVQGPAEPSSLVAKAHHELPLTRVSPRTPNVSPPMTTAPFLICRWARRLIGTTVDHQTPISQILQHPSHSLTMRSTCYRNQRAHQVGVGTVLTARPSLKQSCTW